MRWLLFTGRANMDGALKDGPVLVRADHISSYSVIGDQVFLSTISTDYFLTDDFDVVTMRLAAAGAA